MSDRYNVVYFETSAKSGQGLTNSVERLIQMVMKRVEESVEKDYLPMK